IDPTYSGVSNHRTIDLNNFSYSVRHKTNKAKRDDFRKKMGNSILTQFYQPSFYRLKKTLKSVGLPTRFFGLPDISYLAHHMVFRRSEEHTSELQSRENLVCRLLLEKKKRRQHTFPTTRILHH